VSRQITSVFTHFWILVFAISCLSGFVVAEIPEQEEWQFNNELSYFTGTIGTDTRQSAIYVPMAIRGIFLWGLVGVSVPYVSVRTTGETTLVNGRLQRIRTSRVSSLAPSGTVANDGQGDIVFDGTVNVLGGARKPEELHLALKGLLKAPTADDHKGLGTGKLDGGGGMNIDKGLGPKARAFFQWTYLVIGSPGDTHLNNQFAYKGGFDYQVISSLKAELAYHEYTALLSGERNPRSISVSALIDVIERDRKSVV